MKEKVLGHIALHLGGIIHNLNTPLMWIMGRSQLLQSRLAAFDSIRSMSDDDISKLKEKAAKDIESINQGSEKIDQILKNISYKIQMANEGYNAIEIREYLTNEMEYMLGDMGFKHETRLELNIDPSRSFYTKLNYNSLSWAIISIIEEIMESTSKGRTIKIDFSGTTISINCPDIVFSDEIKSRIEDQCRELREDAAISICDLSGLTVRIVFKEN